MLFGFVSLFLSVWCSDLIFWVLCLRFGGEWCYGIW